MVADELKNYIRSSLAKGNNINDISKNLLENGWLETDILDALSSLGFYKSKPQKTSRILVLFIILIIVSVSSTLYFWKNDLNLSDTNSKKVQNFYANLSASQIAFTNAGEMIFPDEQKLLNKKEEYMKSRINFIEANLQTMKLHLYSDGKETITLDIIGKGQDGSWWETPTGDYKVLGKETNHYSSIGDVWMPWSIQFYGNYFIHGWPYYNDGTLTNKNYSGGCIKLSTEDAKTVFEFSKKDTPILILEDRSQYNFGHLVSKDGSPAPNISAKSFLISNLVTGESLLEKNADQELSIASLTKLMSAIVAKETIYLGREIINNQAADNYGNFSPQKGAYYSGFDLLFPLLMESSNEAAKILSSFVGESYFVNNMNQKAKSIYMENTRFSDSAGINADNISNARDLEKMIAYIYYKSHFIFDITKGIAPENVGLVNIGHTIDISSLKNFNEFASYSDIVGMKNGETTAAKQTLVSVWNINTPTGIVPVSIIVLGSDDRKNDTEKLLNWVKINFNTI